MINIFIVKAIPGSNILKVVLDGNFMKSEVELALLLIKNESLKLKEGYRVIADLSKFKTKGAETTVKKILQSLGSNSKRTQHFTFNKDKKAFGLKWLNVG